MFAYRIVAHVDMDAFFASIEQRDRPELRGRPVVVGALPGERGVVAAASYEARAYGIRSAMPIAEAVRRCPHAVFLRPNFSKYDTLSRRVMRLLQTFTPVVEPVSVDEAFCDLTGCPVLRAGWRKAGDVIRRAIREAFDLPCTVGVGPNKFCARLATELAKPDAVGVIRPQDLPQGIAHLSVRYLWGVGPKTQVILQGAGVRTFGDVQARTLAQMRALLGAHGERLWRLARGEDDEPVTPVRVVKSVSHETTFGQDTVDMAEIEGALRELAEGLARRLRARGWEAAEVCLKLRTAPFTTRTCRHRLSRPTASGGVLFTAARTLVDRLWDRSEPVRLVGIQATRLQPASYGQCLLFDDHEARLRRIGELADRVNRRYGRRVMRTAGELGGEARQNRWLRPEREERL